MKTLLLYSPVNGHIGGTGLLFSRVCCQLVERYDFKLTIVDFKGGGVSRFLDKSGISYDMIPFVGEATRVTQTYDFVMTNLLSAKAVKPLYECNRMSRTVFWMTYTADAYKWLPLATLTNRAPRWWRKVVTLLHKKQSSRITKTIQNGMRANGIFLMDEECARFTRDLFPFKSQPNILHICSGGSGEPIARKFNIDRPTIVWVGRLEDFKTAPLSNFLKAAHHFASECKISRIHIVGDGLDRRKIELLAEDLSDRITVNMCGHMDTESLKDFLLKNADIFIGHGTSILEAAQKGIPGLLVDPTYLRFSPEDFKAEWIYEQKDGGVGRLIESRKQLTGKTWPSIYSQYQAGSAELSDKCYKHWLSNHSPEIISDALYQKMKKSTYTLEQFMCDGGAFPGWFGRLIDGSKPIIKKFLTKL